MNALLVRQYIIPTLFCLLFIASAEQVLGQRTGVLFQRTPAYLQFSDPNYIVSEEQTNAVITIIRTGEYRQSVSVQYTVGQGTATAGEDYSDTSGTLVIPAGISLAEFAIPIHADGQLEPPETVLLVLSNPGQNGLILEGQATLTIYDTAPTNAVATPQLLIQSDGRGHVLISWPASAENCVLEKSANPGGSGWTAVDAVPNTASGWCAVTEDAFEKCHFYRLRVR